MWRQLLRYLAVHKFAAVVAETAIAIVCFMGDAFPVGTDGLTWKYFASWIGTAFIVAVTFQIFLHLRDLYDFQAKPSSPDFLMRLGQALLLASLVLIVTNHFSTIVIVRFTTLIRVSLVLSVWHVLLRVYFGRAGRTNILIIGTGQLARALATEVLQKPHLGFNVAGFLDDNPALQGVSIVNPNVIGFNKDLPRVIVEKKIQKVVVELQDRRGRLPCEQLLALKTHGMDIEEATSVYERLTGKVAIDNLKPSWMIFNDGFEVSLGLLL